MQTLSRRTVILAGGGTGGHLFPGIAVAEELLRRDATTRVLFVGSEKPLERDIVARAGFEHIALPSVSPSLSPTKIWRSLSANARAFRQAHALFAHEHPHVIVGLGGFASVPPALAAWRANVPIVLLEQNVVPGKATRWLSRFADRVCLSWEEAAARLPSHVATLVTGNPIRREIAQLATTLRVIEPSPPTLLILGGSQGATTLNHAVAQALEVLRPRLTLWRIVHQSGAADAESLRHCYAATSLPVEVQPFLPDMCSQYRAATAVISRAGATTLAELACAGLPAILLPLPTSAHDHQRLNARMLSDRSAALLVEQAPDGTAPLLATAVEKLLTDATERARLRQAIRALARPDAASAVVQALSFRSELI